MLRRTWLVLPLLLALLIVPTGAANAKLVVNESGTLTELAAEWYEDGGESWTWGYAFAYTMNRETRIEFYTSTETPLYPSEPDEPMCWEYSYTYAEGPGTLVAGKRFETGYAEGSLQGWSETSIWCEGDWDEEIGVMNGPTNGGDAFTVDVTIDFAATSPLYRQKGSGSFKLPGEFNEHYRYSSEYRLGEAEIGVDEETLHSDWALLGSLKYKYHLNTKW